MLQTLPITTPPCIDAQASCAPSEAANGDAGAFVRALRQAGASAPTPTPAEQPTPAAPPRPGPRAEVRAGAAAARERIAGPHAPSHPVDDSAPACRTADAARSTSQRQAIDAEAGGDDASTPDTASPETGEPVDATASTWPDRQLTDIAEAKPAGVEQAPVAALAPAAQKVDLRRCADTPDAGTAVDRPIGPSGALAGQARMPHASITITPAATTIDARAVADLAAAGAEPEQRSEAALPASTPNAAAIAAERDALFTAAAPGIALPPAVVDAAAPQARDLTPKPMAGATLAQSVGGAEFAPAFGSQVALWVRDGVQEARLQLHPAELGPVSIQIALDGSAAQVDFHAAHAQTRAAIEASLPALASALRESGFTLSGGGVFGQSAGDTGGRAAAQDARDRRSAHDPGPPSREVMASVAPRARPWRRGLLDVFA